MRSAPSLLLLLLLASVGLHAEDLVSRLAAAAKAVPTVALTFVQVKTLAMLDAPLEAHGTLTLDRPQERLVLEFTGRSRLVLDHGQLSRFDAAGQQETLGPEAAAIAAQLHGLLSGDFSTMDTLFTITPATDGSAELTLVPRTPELHRFIERLELRFRPDLAAPAVMTLIATGGDATTYTFSQ